MTEPIRFPLVDQYVGTLLDVDVAALEPGETVVVESERRLRCEQSYGFVHALWGIWFADGRVAVSVPPGARDGVLDVLREAPPGFDAGLMERLAPPVDRALQQAGLAGVRGRRDIRQFACNDELVSRRIDGELVRLRDERIPSAEGLRLPAHCFPDGIVYAVVEEGRAVSIAYAHRSGLMEDRVADLAIDTAEPYRRRGYARTCVSAVTRQVTGSGGEGLYNCSVNNVASAATARSAGYVLYGRTIVLTADDPAA